MSWILNTKTGILHTKACADGLTGNEPVASGSRKPYSNIENARRDAQYKKDHNHPDCLG